MYKFNEGEYVIYGRSGLCRIESVEKRDFGGAPEDYYILKPQHSKSSTVFVPCNNEKLTEMMKTPLTKEEIDSLLCGTVDSSVEWIDDKKERPKVFKSILTGGDRRQILSLLRCLYLKKKELETRNKNLCAGDEKLFSETEKLINEEFAFSLGIDSSEVNGYIGLRIDA